jgi:transcriptional antiterminator
MREDLRERRNKVFDLLVIKGYEYGDVVAKIAERFDVTERTVENDISNMSDWLPEVSQYDDDDGVAKILELRRNRQRLQQMATEARKEGDLRRELRIRRSIEASVETETELAQSLGHMTETPDKHEVQGEINVSDLIDEDAN